MTRTHTAALPVLLLLLLAGCSDLLTESYDYGQVDVRVVDRGGQPAPGLNVIFYSSHRHVAYGQTDAHGRAAFDFVPEGNYGVSLTLNHRYVSPELDDWAFQDGIVLGPGAAAEVVFTVFTRGPGRVHVDARDEETGEPVPGVELTLIDRNPHAVNPPDDEGDPPPEPPRAVTGPDGQASFEEVGWGAYRIDASAPEGYAVIDSGETFVMDEGWVEEVKITLARLSGNGNGEGDEDGNAGGGDDDGEDGNGNGGNEGGNDGENDEGDGNGTDEGDDGDDEGENDGEGGNSDDGDDDGEGGTDGNEE